jgi:DNA polymerase-3 subunit delta'
MTIGVNEDASQIKIAQIRQALSLLSFQPLEGRNKVFIIDPANLMNLESANALLKGLEEPPPSSFFVLVSVNVHELPVTVRSRCQVYHFSPLTLDDIRKHGIEDELLVRWSQGSIGRARTTDPAGLKQQREFLLGFLETALRASETEFQQMLAASAALSRSKQDFGNHLDILTVLVSDLLYITENIPALIVNIDIQDRVRRLAASVSAERIIRITEFLQFIERSMKNNVNRQMLTDVLAMVGNETTSKILHDNSFKTR